MKQYITLKNLGWFLTIIVSLMLGMGGLMKISQSEEMIQNFTNMHLLPYITFVGVFELVGVALLINPRTSAYGALTLGTAMTGAVCLHFALFGGAGAMVPFLLGLGAWSGHCLRTYSLKLA